MTSLRGGILTDLTEVIQKQPRDPSIDIVMSLLLIMSTYLAMAIVQLFVLSVTTDSLLYVDLSIVRLNFALSLTDNGVPFADIMVC